MTIFGDILSDALGNLFVVGGNDNRAAKLLSEGELVPAKIYAIRCVDRSDSAETWSYGLDLQTSNGPLRASVEQRVLGPAASHLTLGRNVKARHLNGKVGIDWEATAREAGLDPGESSSLPGKTLRKPLEPGVEDNRFNSKRLKNGTRAIAKVVELEPYVAFGMPTQQMNITVAFTDGSAPREVVIKRALVPSYGAEQLTVGAKVPIAVDAKNPDKISIDWFELCEPAANLVS